MRKQDLAWQLRERSLFEWTVPDEWRLNKQGGFVFEFLLEWFGYQLRDTLYLDAFLYLSVGRHHPKKGFSDLISAAALLRKKASRPFRLAIAGKHTETLKSQVAKQGLTEHVHLLGEISDQDAEGSPFEAPSNKLVGLYKSADAFVFPSHVESFGIAIIEAMAASLPIITTDGPGCRDVIGQGKYGIMVPVKDHEGLAEAMNQLLSHKDLREKYINISRERALVFAWRSIVNQYLEAYRTIIRRKAL